MRAFAAFHLTLLRFGPRTDEGRRGELLFVVLGAETEPGGRPLAASGIAAPNEGHVFGGRITRIGSDGLREKRSSE